MNKDQLQKAIISILIGAMIMVLNQVFALLLEFIQSHYDTIVPSATGMVAYLTKWRTSQIG